MSEGMRGLEDEPEIQLVEGTEVEKYLTPELKDKFVRQLIVANNEGVFDQKYFDRYMGIFQRRINEGKMTLLLVDGVAAGVGGIDIMGKYSDGRMLYEMGSLSVLPEYQGQGYASVLMRHRFDTLRKLHPQDPISVSTCQDVIERKCIELGLKKKPGSVMIKVYNPKEKFPDLTHEAYEAQMTNWGQRWEQEDGYRFYVYDPLESGNDSRSS